MAESVYKVIELVGTSGESWEKAASSTAAPSSDVTIGFGPTTERSSG